jgi:hypothetical protein
LNEKSPLNPIDDRDLLDEAMEIPLVNAGVSRLQRVLGPSCLASLVVLLILTVLFRRWVHLPPLGMAMLLVVVWMLVLGVMVRFRNDELDDAD